MACHSVLQHGRHHCVYPAGRDPGHGPLLPPSALVHCLIHWREHGALDNGMDG